MSDLIPVVMCCDRNYAPYAAVASYSLCKHTRHDLKLIWLVPVADVPLIEPVLSRMADMSIRPMVIPVDGEHFAQWKQVGHNNLTSYFRLLIPDLLPEKKAIYLDADVLVLDDLGELFATDMQGALIGGVLDDGAYNKKFDVLSNSETYINTGVMLMDLDGLREHDFLLECSKLNDAHGHQTKFMDQCIINLYADNRKCLLDARWNFQALSNWTKYSDFQARFNQVKPAIVHYIGSAKPWQGWCNPPIAHGWQQHADEAMIPGLSVIPVTQLAQALELAKVLDINENFHQASQLKSQIIQTLMAPRSDLST